MSKPLPALSESTFLRYFHFIGLYFAQGIPEGMVYFGIPAWMAMNGKSAGEIGGFVAAYGLPWSFKIIVAPLMDRFTYLPMGRRRPWIIFGQLGLILSFIAMAFVPDPLNNLSLLMAMGFTVGFFGSFQDVATDGLAIDIIPVDQQARANGFMWGSKILGSSISLALGSWLLNKYSFSSSILSLSALVGLIMLVPLCLRERPNEKLLPWLSGSSSHEAAKMQLTSWKIIFKSLYRVFSLRNSMILAVVMFLSQIAYSYLATLLPIFTVQSLGWTDQVYAKIFAVASLVGGIGGMVIGGILIDRYGKKLMMNVYFISLVVLTAAFVIFKGFWSATWYMGGFMILYQIFYVFACIGLFSIAMECCWKKVSATQFTIYMTIGNIGRIVGAKLIGAVRLNFTWEYTLLAFAVLISLAWLTMQFLNIKTQVQKVHDLEASEFLSRPVYSV